MKINQFGHQGDVWLTKVRSIPQGVRKNLKTKKGETILAYGEVTGHKHQIKEGEVNFFSVQTSVNIFEQFLEVLSKKATLVHEEHLPFELEQGIYSIAISREYVASEIERKVID